MTPRFYLRRYCESRIIKAAHKPPGIDGSWSRSHRAKTQTLRSFGWFDLETTWRRKEGIQPFVHDQQE